jgi:hypothetical protein
MIIYITRRINTMALSSSDALELGGAVAKGVLAVVFNDPGIGLGSASDLVRIFRSRTSDVYAQRASARRFEEIGELVARSLAPLFEADSTRIPDEEKRAAILAAVEAIEASEISADLLARINLDPMLLSRHIRDHSGSSATLLSVDALQFYQRVILESAIRIIDVSSSIPMFTERVFAEILSGQDTILQKTEEALEELRRLRVDTESLAVHQVQADFEINYRIAISNKLDEIKLFGTPHADQIRRYPLSVAYITLTVSGVAGVTEAESSMIEAPHPTQSSTVAPASVDYFLASSRRLLITGFAGSGKTTLLQWIAVRAATRSFEGPLEPWNDSVPFFVRLRDIARSGLPRPEEWVGLAVPSLAGIMRPQWTHHILSTGRAVLLVDGIDEVSTAQREEVRDWLDELMHTFPDSTYVVTSRPHAVGDRWFTRAGFLKAELEPFSGDSVDTFIDYWHDAVARDLVEEEQRHLLDLADRLKREIGRSNSLARLATNPLLCAMICTLHHHRQEDLPYDRIDLYRACVDLLLERRERARQIELTDYPNIGPRQKWLLISDLAYWMMRNGWTQAAIGEVDRRLDFKRQNLEGIDEGTTGSAIRRLFVERSGLLREPAADQVDFAHRTFQEYLAAVALVEEGDIGLLVKNAGSELWREVTILVAGLANKEARRALIGGLIERGDAAIRGRQRIHLLAVACLETAVELEPEIRNEVRKRLATAVPPQNMTQAKDLASAGELAVPFLQAPARRHRGSVTAACVRALSLIGTENALVALESYATDQRVAVREELIRAWRSSSSPDEFGARLIPLMFGDSETLHVPSVASLSGFEELQRLRELTVLNGQRIDSLQPLSNLSRLQRLVLRFVRRVSDLDGLRGINSLRVLEIVGAANLKRIDGMGGLDNLESFHLSGAVRLESLQGLDACQRLRNLSVSSSPRVSDWSLLGGLSALEMLSLEDLPHGTNLDFLSDLTQLTSLSLETRTLPYWDSRQAIDSGMSHAYRTPRNRLAGSASTGISISAIATLSSLTHLQLVLSEGASDLAPLGSLHGLTHLLLSELRSSVSLEPITKLRELKALYLSGVDPDVDISSLEEITGLNRLVIEGTGFLPQLESFNPPQSLQRLDLAGVPPGADLGFLEEMSGLTHLTIIGGVLDVDLRTVKNSSLTHLTVVGEGTIRGWEALKEIETLETLVLVGLEYPSFVQELPAANGLRSGFSTRGTASHFASYWSAEGWRSGLVRTRSFLRLPYTVDAVL